MAQLPPDSQRATWSHSPSVAAPACPARARLPPPMTAPVKAIFATFTADVVGLRCRPLIGALVSSLLRPRGQLSGSGWRGCPAGGVETTSASPQGTSIDSGSTCSVDQWVPRLRPKLFVVGCSRLDGARRDRGTAGHPIEVEGLGT